MKKLLTFLIGIAFSMLVLYPQEAPPQAFSFKAVITKNGAAVANKTVYLQISILRNNMNGQAVYVETFAPTTNEYGQVDLQIGRGTNPSGVFSKIEWSKDIYFLKIEYKTKVNDPYLLLSNTQLLSVPYSLYTAEAGNGFAKEYTEGEIRPILSSEWGGKLSIGPPPPNWPYVWGPLHVDQVATIHSGASIWGSAFILDASSLNEGYATLIASLGGDAYEGPGKFLIRQGNSEFIMDKDGHTGINNLYPTHSLDVSGDINFTGSLFKNGNPFEFEAQNGFATVYTPGEIRPILNNQGKVSIGQPPTDWNESWIKFSVNGPVSIGPAEVPWGSSLVLDATSASGGGGQGYAIFSLGTASSEGAGKFLIRNTAENTPATFIMDQNGNVGLGLFNPLHRLDVSGDINFTGSLLKNGNPFEFEAQNGFATVYTPGEIRPVLAEEGHVGISQGPPDCNYYRLTVDGATNILPGHQNWAQIVLDATPVEGGTVFGITSTGTGSGEGPGKLIITNYPTGSSKFAMDNNGHVGLGTFSPAYNLDVSGDINFTGTLYQHGNPLNAAPKEDVDELRAMVEALTARIEALEGGGSGSTVTDADGNVYNTVTIGTQVWMKENLKVTHYSNGDPIPNITDITGWKNLTTGAYCWYNNDESNYKDTYGALYNWYTIVDGRNVCPTGWHVPTDEEWTTLETYLINNGYGYEGSGSDIAKSMAATYGWTNYNLAGSVGNEQSSNNTSGFTALPNGIRYGAQGTFCCIIDYGHWWTATGYNSTDAWYRKLHYSFTDLWREASIKKNGQGIRCIKD